MGDDADAGTDTDTATASPTRPAGGRRPVPHATRRDGRLAGVVGAVVALGVVELLGAVLPGQRPLTTAVGDVVVDNSPDWLTSFAIDAFGTNDKLVLLVGMVLVCLVLGALLGQVAARVRWVGPAGFAAFALLGVVAAASDPQARMGSAVAAAIAGAVAGSATLWVLLRAGDRRAALLLDRTGDTASPTPPTFVDRTGDRRSFLALAGGLGAVGVAAGLAGRFGPWPSAAEVARRSIDLPGGPPPPVPPGAELGVPGLSPVITPNADFYRIDTALLVPDVDPAGWELRVAGMVNEPLALTYDDLLAEADLESIVTIACVSNEVGGDLVGTARWLGVPLERLLRRAGVDPTVATQLVGRSVDGFTVGFPTEVAMDGRDAMVAIGMNGEPLPRRHGFPARLIVPGLYGYVSATKWLEEIELTTWDGFDAYWIPRGWAKEAPIKTASRIDVPQRGRRLRPGPVPVAGVAWAPHRGISRVEVQADDGPWEAAELSAALSDDAWRQWRYTWEATPGEHTLRVRATDGDGVTQTEERQSPAPDGATGWHFRTVTVSS